MCSGTDDLMKMCWSGRHSACSVCAQDHQIHVVGLEEQLVNSCEQALSVIQSGKGKFTVTSWLTPVNRPSVSSRVEKVSLQLQAG